MQTRKPLRGIETQTVRVLRFLAVMGLAAVCLAGCQSFAERARGHLAAAGPVVALADGNVEGVAQAGVVRFLGIPYAAPPVGPLRWRPPVRPQAWPGTRPAQAFGPPCGQVYLLGPFGGPANTNEDCLYLNVYAPADAVGSRSRLPVLVWIHGGGYVNGSGQDYDGSKLATDGRMIVVTLNYRLNLMGFLAHPALDAEGHAFGNYGFLDQQMALHWVRQNIAKFGGDPANVTLSGQSAGANSTVVQMTSPLSKGLFHKAIVQSGQSYLTATPLPQAQKLGVEFARAAGCGEGTDETVAACLRALPADAVMRHAGTIKGDSAFIHQRAIQDGQIVLDGAVPLVSQGRFQAMPMMLGTTSDEGQFLLGIDLYLSGSPWKQYSQDDVVRYVSSRFGASYPSGTAERILALYPEAAYATAQLRYGAIVSDTFICRSQRGVLLFAGRVPLYTYEFRDRTAPSNFPDIQGFASGAYHAAEIQYVFRGFRGGPDGISRSLNRRQEKLSDRIVKAWANFARTGNPNGRGDQPWPAYTSQAPVYAVQDLGGPATATGAELMTAHKCDFWMQVMPLEAGVVRLK